MTDSTLLTTSRPHVQWTIRFHVGGATDRMTAAWRAAALEQNVDLTLEDDQGMLEATALVRDGDLSNPEQPEEVIRGAMSRVRQIIGRDTKITWIALNAERS